MESKPFVIGIAGGTSSGKTTVSQSIIKELGEDNITYISFDNYYYDLSHLEKRERDIVNFDHPNSLDHKLLIDHMKLLIQNKSIHMPHYNFCTHTREQDSTEIKSNPILLIEGILVLHYPEIRDMIDLTIFVDTPSDERLIRRIQRDMANRGRTLNDVINQYQKTVKMMHMQFVEPTKAFADFIIPNGYNEVVVKMLVNSMIQLIHTSNRKKI